MSLYRRSAADVYIMGTYKTALTHHPYAGSGTSMLTLGLPGLKVTSWSHESQGHSDYEVKFIHT